MSESESFPATRRVRKQAEFDRVYSGDAYAADHVLVVRGVENDSEETRLGLSVSRRVGNAVVRNRWKRRIREAFRTQLDKLPQGLDLVVRPKKGAEPISREIRRSLPRLAKLLARRLGRKER